MRGRIPAPIAEGSDLLFLSDTLAIRLVEFVEVYNEYVSSRSKTSGKTRLPDMQMEMDGLRNSYTQMEETKTQVNKLWRDLKKQMRWAKQSHLL